MQVNNVFHSNVSTTGVTFNFSNESVLNPPPLPLPLVIHANKHLNADIKTTEGVINLETVIYNIYIYMSTVISMD